MRLPPSDGSGVVLCGGGTSRDATSLQFWQRGTGVIRSERGTIVLGGDMRREPDANIGAADGGVVGFVLLDKRQTIQNVLLKIKQTNMLDTVKLNKSNWLSNLALAFETSI